MPDPPAIAVREVRSLATCTKDGTPKYVPVSAADLGTGKVGFNTEAASWKVKRLRNDPRVAIQPDDDAAPDEGDDGGE